MPSGSHAEAVDEDLLRVGQLLRLRRAGRMQQHARLRGRHRCDPAAVRRHPEGLTSSEPHRCRGASAQEVRVVPGDGLVRQRHGASVRRDPETGRHVAQRHIPRLRITSQHRFHPTFADVHAEQHTAVRGDVEEAQLGGSRVDHPWAPRQGCGQQCRVGPALASGRRVPHLPAVRRPRHAPDAVVPLREDGARPLPIDDRHASGVVGEERMIGKRDAIARRREADVADVAGRLVQHAVDGELEALEPALAPNDGKLGAVGRPLGLAHVLRGAGGVSRRAATRVRACRPPSSPRTRVRAR